MDNASATTVDPAGDGDEDLEKNDDTHDSSNEDDESEYEPDYEELGHGEDAEEDGNDEGGEIGGGGGGAGAGGGEEEEGDEEVEGGEEEEEDEDEEEEEDYSQTSDWPDKCTDCSKFFVGIGARNGAGIATYEGKPGFHFFFNFGALFHHPLPDFMLFPFFLFVYI